MVAGQQSDQTLNSFWAMPQRIIRYNSGPVGIHNLYLFAPSGSFLGDGYCLTPFLIRGEKSDDAAKDA